MSSYPHSPDCTGAELLSEKLARLVVHMKLWAREICSKLKRKPFVWCSSPWKIVLLHPDIENLNVCTSALYIHASVC